MLLELDYAADDLTSRYARSKILKATFEERSKTLKPCPFCDGSPRITPSYWSHTGTYIDHKVICTGCGVTATRGNKVGDADAVEVWNRRA